MLYKGMVVKIKSDFAIVLTDENEFLKIQLKDQLKIGSKIMFTEEDVLQTTNKSTDWKERINMSRKLIAIAASLVILVSAGIIGYNFLQPDEVTESETESQTVLSMLSDEAVSVVSIDINPSIELFLDANEVVIDIKALNEDALTLDLTQFIGMNAEDAVEGIVTLANEAGFINQDDLTEDYVLLTIADINEDETDDVTELETRLRDRIQSSDELQSLNVAILKSTRAEILEAEGKDVPFGLYVLNGMIESNGEYITIKDFFSDPANKEAFLQKGEMINMSIEKKTQLAEKIMTQLENQGADVSNIRSMLGDPNMDIDQVLTQMRTNYENYGTETGNSQSEDNNSNNGNNNATTEPASAGTQTETTQSQDNNPGNQSESTSNKNSSTRGNGN